MPGWDTSRPNWIMYRRREPTYERYGQREVQSGVWFVFGWKQGKSEVQSIRFDKRKGWTLDRAKKWVAAHRNLEEFRPEDWAELQTVSEDTIKRTPEKRIITKPMPGILLVKPHGTKLAEGKKKLIVSAKPVPELYMKKNLYVVEAGKALAVITIERQAGPWNAERVRARLRGLHLITDEEWKKWWPDVKEVYVAYPKVVELLDEPVPVEIPQGVQKWIKEVKVKLPVKEAELTDEGVTLVTPEQLQNILKDPGILKRHTAAQLRDDHRICHMWSGKDWKTLPKDLTKEQVRTFHGLLLKEMKRRELPFEHTTALERDSIEEIAKKAREPSPYAPIHRYGEKKGREIKIEEILQAYQKPMKLVEGHVKLVGGIPDWGDSDGDIDLRIAEDDLEAKHPMVFRLGRALSPDIANRAQYHDRTHDAFTAYVDLYDLWWLPSERQSLIRMEEEKALEEIELQRKGRVETIRDSKAKSEAAASLKENKVKPLRFVLPLKGHKAYYKWAELVPGVVSGWFKEEQLRKGVVGQKKYDGVMIEVMKQGDNVVMRSDDGVQCTKRFPTIVKLAKQILPDTCTIFCEVEKWVGNRHHPREEVAGYVHAHTPPDDSSFVFNVFDIAYFMDKGTEHHELPGSIGDLHEKPYEVRLRYLKLIRFKQSTDGIPKAPGFNLTPSTIAKTPANLVKVIKQKSNTAASEGSVIKALDMIFELDGLSASIIKFKRMAELHAIVVDSKETRTSGVFNLFLGLRIPAGWKVPEKLIYTVGNKKYQFICKTFNVKGVKQKGTIVTLSFHTLNHYIKEETGEQWVAAYEPKFIEARPQQKTPDSAKEAIRIAKEAELFEVKHLAAVELALPMDDEPHKSVMQNHFRCEFEQYLPEGLLPGSPAFEDALNRFIRSKEFEDVTQVLLEDEWGDWTKVFLGKSVHLDWRILIGTMQSGDLRGYTVAHMRPGRVTKPVETLAEAKAIANRWDHYFKMSNKPQTYILSTRRKLWVESKKAEPVEWMKAQGIVPKGETGATRYEFGVFHIVDKPTVYLGAQKADFAEFFLYGKRFTGRWVIRLLPNPWKAEMPRREFISLMWKPEDQMPYVISRRAVKKQWIPQPNVSALPPEIRQQIPAEYHYWKERDKSKRLAVRENLVAAIKEGKTKIRTFKVVGKK